MSLTAKSWLFESRMGLYLVIGGTASAIDVGVFIYLYEIVGLSALTSHSISIPLAAIHSFTCNAYLNFKKTDKLLFRFISFAIIVGLGYLLGAGIILIVDDVFKFGGTLGKLISLPFVFFFQFYLNSKISFGY